MTGEKIVSTTIPFPSGGWNAADSLDAMPSNDARVLKNLYRTGTKIRIRGGREQACTGCGADSVDSLAELVTPAGTVKLVGFGDGGIYDVTGSSATDITNSTLTPTTNKWQTVQLAGTLLMFNGADQAQQWSGTGDTTDATYTGFNDDNLVQGTLFKNRLYAVTTEPNYETYLLYGGTKSKTGALTGFDLAYYLRNGGGLQWVSSFSGGTGQVSQDLLVIAGTQGDILIYSGDYPENAWEQIAHFDVGRTLGRRSYVHIPGDLLIISECGVFSVSQLLQMAPLVDANYFAKLNDHYRDMAKLYAENFGWEGFYYKAKDMIGINVPRLVASGADCLADQLVIHRASGAPALFTDQPANCWLVSQNRLFLGGYGGIVYEADIGLNDDTAAIDIEYRSAFNYFDDRRNVKQFESARPLFQADTACSLTVAVDVDFAEGLSGGGDITVGSTGTPWGSPWGSSWSASKALQNAWATVSGIGYAASLVIQASLEDVDFELCSSQIRYKIGSEI